MDPSPAVSIPRIATSRLLLREHRMGDFDAFAASVADPIAQKHLAGTLDRRMAYRLFAAGLGYWMLQGAGWWSVEVKATQTVVGSVGAFFREGEPDLEIGWSLYRAHWGQGYATEAAGAALAWGLERFGKTRAIAHIDAANTASIKVSERLGMRYETDVDFFGTTTGRYAVERP